MRCDFKTIIKEEKPQAIRLANILKNNLNIKTAIDIGCGPGIYVKELQKIGVDAVGFDIDDRATGKNVYICDIFSSQYLDLISSKFDIAICLEVAEHIENIKSVEIVSRICKSSNLILFSAAVPGQGGTGHINCQKKEYWIKLFNKNNFFVDINTTKTIIDEMSSGYHLGWFKNNAIVFRKKEDMILGPKQSKPKYRFHIPGLPHTKTNKEFSACAYSMKVLKLCKMLTEAGHTVYHYGVEGGNPVCTENINVVSNEIYSQYYNYDHHTEFFKFDTSDLLHQTFYANTITEIRKRMEPRDFLLCAWGWGHQPIAIGVPECMVVESGIGYSSTFANYRVFESSTWMSWVYGNTKQDNGSWYDCVIPNFFDPDDFEFREKKEDYFLYLGRLVQRKGVDIAFQVTKEIGAKLVVAGQGSLKNDVEKIDIRGDHVEFVGYADVEKRKKLLAGAKALFVSTYFVEPFGGVSIEAAFSGTPVISTDWGVFPDNVLHGITGYRCRTFEQFVWAAKNIHNIKPAKCRQWAMDNFSCDRVVLMYEEYFQMLQDLYKKNGWYERRDDRTDLDWLNRKYPS